MDGASLRQEPEKDGVSRPRCSYGGISDQDKFVVLVVLKEEDLLGPVVYRVADVVRVPGGNVMRVSK